MTYEFPHIFKFMLFLYRYVLSVCTRKVTIVLSVQSHTSPYYNLSIASYPSTDITIDTGIFTRWSPCWASLGWLDLTFVFILLCPAHGPEGGMLVRIHSAWSKMSWAPAAKCTPSPTASSEMLLRNATVPGGVEKTYVINRN